ncbi:MAG TPA: LON peptidase substrate-binding domain-containing protein, partial [Chroococcales cyanobacterium]
SLPDGRMNIMTRGVERFSVQEVIDERAYYEAKVEARQDEDSDGDAVPLAEELRNILKDISHLSSKLADSEDIDLVKEAPDSPTELSFWIPANLYRSRREQQDMLELDKVSERLKAEVSVLDNTRKHLAARAALKDVFSS